MRSRVLTLTVALAFIALGGADACAFSTLDPAKVSANVEGGELVIRRLSDGQEIERVGVTKVSQGDRFYHWTQPENQARWVRQGLVDKGEMDFLATPSGTRQAYGPGFYVSNNPIDSNDYGPQGVVASAPRDYYLVNEDLSHLKDPKTARETHEVLKRAGVFGNQATDTWRVLFDEYAVSQLKPIDAGAMLDHYASQAGKVIDLRVLENVAAKFTLRPHPAIEAAFPSVQKVLAGTALNAGEETVIQGIFRDYRHLRAALEPILPPDTMARFRLNQALASKRPVTEVLKLDQDVGGLKSSPLLREKAPDLADLLEGKPLSAEGRAKIWSALGSTDRYSDALALFEVELKAETSFLGRLRREFAPELREAFRTHLPSNANISQWLPAARQWGFGLNELVPGLRDPGGGLPRGFVTADPGRNIASLSDFGKNLAQSFAFIDHFDLARAVAEGNPEPWKLYDEPGKAPLIDRWQNALAAQARGSSTLDIQQALAGEPVSFRGKRVVAGGDVMIPGEAFGFARMTEEQVAALRNNRFLTVYVKEDPWPQHGGRKTNLVRYEYPSAATFENFKADLSDRLVSELSAAKKAGKLASEQTAEFQGLTRKIVQELWASTRDEDPLVRYQRRVAVHPFEDYNGRLTRLLYRAETGKPLVLPQWDLDLLSHPAELAAHQGQGDLAYRKIVQGLVNQEKLNPQFPRYYDAPEIFNTLLDLPDSAQASADELKAFLKDPAVGDMLRKKEITEARWRLWDLEGRRWAKLSQPERAAALKDWIDARFVPEFHDEKLLRQLLEESKSLAAADPAVARWWLQAASGPDPAHGAVIADFMRSLDPKLSQELASARLLAESPLSLPYTASERAAFQAETATALGDPNVDKAEKLRRARLYVRQQIANPADRARPFDEILKLASAAPDPAFFKGFEELLQDPRFPERRQLFEAALLLPKDGLLQIRDTLLRQLVGRQGARPSFAPEVAKRFAERGDAELAGLVFKNVEAGYLPGDLLRDEKLFRRYLGSADLKNPAERLYLVARDPSQAQRALQSFADRKEWADFFAVAKMMDLNSLIAPRTPLEKQVRAVLKSGLTRAASADPSRELLSNIFLSQIETDEALKAAAEDRAQKAMIRSFGTPEFNQNFALFISGPDGKERAYKLFPTIFAGESANLIETVKHIPYEMLENIRWRKEYDEAIAGAVGKLSREGQAEFLQHLARSSGEQAKARMVVAFQASDPRVQAAFLEGARDYYGSHYPAGLMRAAAGSPDAKVRAASMRNFASDKKLQAELADLFQRLLTKGDSALFEKPLPLNWNRVAELYLSQVEGRDYAGIQERWRTGLLAELKKPPKAARSADHVNIMEFLTRDHYSWPERAEAIYAAIESVNRTSMDELTRRGVQNEAFRRLRTSGQYIDAKRIYDIYQQSRDPQLINEAVALLERTPYSEEKAKLLAEGLMSQVNDVSYTARRQLRDMVSDTTYRPGAHKVIRDALENFVKRDPTRAWRGYTSDYQVRELASLFKAVGMDPDAAARSIKKNQWLKAGADKLETCALRFQLLVPGKRNQAQGRLKARKPGPESWRPPSMLKDPAIVAMGGVGLVGAAAVVDMAYTILLDERGRYGEMREPYTIKALSAAMRAATGIYATGEDWVKYVMMSDLEREQKARFQASIKEAEERERQWRREREDRDRSRNAQYEIDRARREQQRRREERERIERYRREAIERYGKNPYDDDSALDEGYAPGPR